MDTDQKDFEDDGRPIFSVIIPTYNHAHCIKAAIASVRKQKRCAEGDIEIIVVNDASTDNTVEVLSKLQSKIPSLKVIHHEKNLGVSAARNTGIRAATGEFITFLDSDDTWYAYKLALQFAEITKGVFELHELQKAGEEMPDDDAIDGIMHELFKTFCFTYYDNKYVDGGTTYVNISKVFTDGKDEEGHLKSKIYTEDELTRGAVTWNIWLGIGSTLFAHRSAIERNGFFNENLGCGEETEYVVRHVLGGGKIRAVPYPLMAYSMPEPNKPYRGQDIHYGYMVDTYRCRIAKMFGPETARSFIDKISGFHANRASPGEAWHGASHELTVLPNAPCETGFECSLKGSVCHRPNQSQPGAQRDVVEVRTAGL